jgi:PBP1b-binding outer membrane lipoprotein LpoB
MKRLTLGSLLILALTLGGCVVYPAGPRVYARPAAVVVAAPVVRVY